MAAVATALPFYFKTGLTGSGHPKGSRGTTVLKQWTLDGREFPKIVQHDRIHVHFRRCKCDEPPSPLLGRVPSRANAAHHFGRAGSQPARRGTDGRRDGPRPPPSIHRSTHSLQHTTENIEGILLPCAEAATNTGKEASPDGGAHLHRSPLAILTYLSGAGLR